MPPGSVLPPGWTAEQGRAAVERLGPLSVAPTLVPTIGLLAVLLAAGVLYLLAGVAGSGALVAGCAALLALPVVAYLLRPRLSELEVQRLLLERGSVGEQVQTTLRVTHHGRRTSARLHVLDHIPGHGDLRLVVAPLAPGERVELTAPRPVLRRGADLGGVVRLQAWSPVGLLVAKRDVPFGGDVRAWPAVPAQRRPPAGGGGTGEQRRTRPVAGSGQEVLSLRDWRAGDGARAVSARASARHGRPMVLERQRDDEIRVVLLVCAPAGRAIGAPERERWERGLERAGALVAPEGPGTQASLIGPTPAVLGPPGAAVTGRWSALDALAAADLALPLTQALADQAVVAAGPGGRLALVSLAPAPAALQRRCRAARVALVELVELVEQPEASRA